MGHSEFSMPELAAMSTALYGFNGAIKTFQTHLEIYEDNEVRLKTLEYLSPVLSHCTEALSALEDCLKGSSFLANLRYLARGKLDRKLKNSLKALDGAKELFMIAVHADQQ